MNATKNPTLEDMVFIQNTVINQVKRELNGEEFTPSGLAEVHARNQKLLNSLVKDEFDRCESNVPNYLAPCLIIKDLSPLEPEIDIYIDWFSCAVWRLAIDTK